MNYRANVREGMVVYSADRVRLGKIVSCQPTGFAVEKGLFLPKASHFRYEDIADISNGVVSLSHARAALAEESFWSHRQSAESAREVNMARNPSDRIGSDSSSLNLGALDRDRPIGRRDDRDDIRVQLAEEELTVEKHMRDFGEVRIHKRVVVTHKQITVPVMHEVVVVERVPLDSTAKLGNDAFTEASFSVPLHEEEVEIHKHPIVREEVRLKRRQLQEERAASAEIRKEEIDIDQPKYVAHSNIKVIEDGAFRH